MVNNYVAEYPVDVSIGLEDGNIDLYRAYIKKVECEFTSNVDELLEELNLMHLRVKNN